MSQWSSLLKERVDIQQPIRTVDELGGANIAWTPVVSVWAQVEPVLGTARERETGAQLLASAAYRVRIRTRTDINAAMRLVWKTHTLTIHSLHERAEVLELLAYEEAL
jgi:head-tail adaptor